MCILLISGYIIPYGIQELRIDTQHHISMSIQWVLSLNLIKLLLSRRIDIYPMMQHIYPIHPPHNKVILIFPLRSGKHRTCRLIRPLYVGHIIIGTLMPEK